MAFQFGYIFVRVSLTSYLWRHSHDVVVSPKLKLQIKCVPTLKCFICLWFQDALVFHVSLISGRVYRNHRHIKYHWLVRILAADMLANFPILAESSVDIKPTGSPTVLQLGYYYVTGKHRLTITMGPFWLPWPLNRFCSFFLSLTGSRAGTWRYLFYYFFFLPFEF